MEVMISAVLLLALAASAPPSQPPPPGTVIPFRTEAQPRVDPVFGDAGALRAAVGRFPGRQAGGDGSRAVRAERARVRDDFPSAAPEPLAALAPAPAATKSCPAAAGAPYARALAAGSRYLALGQQLQARYRDIRRADDLGDG